MTHALVVDDNEDNLYYVRAVLEAGGFDVESAHDGAEALAKARKSPPVFVISDLLMPVMDGYALLGHWKADPQLSAAPFIVYTATYTDAEDEQLALRLGADAFILKPTEPDALLARLRGVLARPTASIAPASSHRDGYPGELLREYNEVLVHKLEHKTLELERINRTLQQDIAAREVAEAALRVSEASFRLLTEAMPQLVWIAGDDGRAAFVNRRWLEYTGLTPAESEGGGWSKPLHPDDRAAAGAAWAEATASGRTYSVEARLRGRDDTYRWWLVRALPLRDETGSVTKWFGTCTDIQEMKHAAAELARAQERTRQGQKMEAIGQLSAGLAHDFNNMLSVILSYTSFIIDELKPEDPLRADAEEVRAAGQRAAQLTAQLMAFGRQQALTPRNVDLHEIVRGIETMLQRLLGASIEISVLAAEPLGLVFVDPGQVEQIIVNLVVNARDAMPTGGRITIHLESIALDAEYAATQSGVTPGPHIMLAVSDTGHGMDAETRNRIFEPFFTTKDKGKGTGLGLATVYGIVTQSGGHIRVDSDPGSGTTFRIYLPQSGAAQPVMPHPPRAAIRGGSETILLVEDSEQVRSAARSVLQRAGYHVLDARSGADALLICEQHPRGIHLLLTDVVMPGITGQDLARRVLKERPAVAVLFTSGYTQDAIGGAGLGGTKVAFLPKPISPDALLTMTRQVLDAAAAQRGPGADGGSRRSLGPPAARSEHILHVDDEESLVELTRRILHRLGYRVSGFTDPRLALAAFQANPAAYDAVVTDVAMVEMSGFDLIRALRQSRADIPVVVTSGYFRAEDMREAEALQPCGLLVKPNTVHELGLILHEELCRHSVPGRRIAKLWE